MMTREIITGSGNMLWTGNMFSGTIAGFPAATSVQFVSDAILFGAFDQLLIGSWGTLALEVDPFTKFQSGIIGARVHASIDVALRDVGAFSKAESIT